MNKSLSKTLSSDCSQEDKFAKFPKFHQPKTDLYKTSLTWIYKKIYKDRLVNSPPVDTYVFIHPAKILSLPAPCGIYGTL